MYSTKKIIFYLMLVRFLTVVFLWMFLGTSCSLNESGSELCFIGDSITYLWDVEYYFPGYYIHKHAVSGAQIQDIDKWNTSDCRGIPVVLLMGTNNIGFISVSDSNAEYLRERFKEKFWRHADAIGGNPLWVVSILPRNYNGKQSIGVNQNIELLNQMIKKDVDSKGNAYKFIDVFNLFLDEGYHTNMRLFKDGLHPNVEGYEVLSAKVQSKL